jgi:hypothetical protein
MEARPINNYMDIIEGEEEPIHNDHRIIDQNLLLIKGRTIDNSTYIIHGGGRPGRAHP